MNPLLLTLFDAATMERRVDLDATVTGSGDGHSRTHDLTLNGVTVSIKPITSLTHLFMADITEPTLTAWLCGENITFDVSD